jgi:hypothetical protein
MTPARAAKWALGLLASTALAGGTALPAAATVVDGGRYADAYGFSYADCGFPVDVTGAITGSYRIRAGKGDDASAFFLRDRFSYSEVHTNADTGEWFVLRGQGVFNEVGATRVDGSIFEFRSIDAGQPFVVEDSSGDLVLRDRGVVRKRILFDTGGDDEPGGTEIEFVGFDVAGPHPGLFLDFCGLVRDLIG